ncbi:hypothetical protein ACLB9X_33635 [Streptomyces sp. 5K101]|uniref:hypothetical protein n=1 Tax=Streptomyces sp. 5K101 TaxID=3390037 RepID=UPI003974FFA9
MSWTRAEETTGIEGFMAIQDSLESLIGALRHHAEVMSSPELAGDTGIEAFEALRAAAVAYGETVREETHWDSPFAELVEYEEDLVDHGEDARAAFEAEPDVERFVVSGVWTFDVTDRDAWTRFTTQYLRAVPGAPQQLSGDPAEAAAALLAYGDLLAPFVNHGIVNVGQDWTIRGSEEVLDDLEDLDD